MQDTVERHMRRYGLSGNAEIRYIDLVSEVGELGRHEYSDNAKMEMGDCIFALLALCCGMRIDAREALETALAKYDERFSTGGGISSEIIDEIPNQEGLT
jgi:uncharacterized protein YabN with tetrapyrrole methylase and pyrophosphatase domain|nr:MazG nucleotide pyrophosphohydrolase domain-containing protein [uncultured Acetatifactor sp.]